MLWILDDKLLYIFGVKEALAVFLVRRIRNGKCCRGFFMI